MIKNENGQKDTDKYFCLDTNPITGSNDFIQRLNELKDNAGKFRNSG